MGKSAIHSKSFKRSNDPFFIEKLRDILRRYPNLLDQARVPASTRMRQYQAPTAPY